ncbi:MULTISPECIES: ribonuclease Z [Hymenobacter]|uniref:Ribonuclease Z n=1 Tax=Hymenobacter jejuensis TaxID=2502781 RepID=A0A5B8A1L5_9BACT|nr:MULTISPECIES: ribonuclease Z [Hymenobacter]MBC6989237.1 ribonuclease Z [Hymenobacter sp. BT491]QDA61274.1 ribonuclease Z [Hymenobacter jejuensis]
MEFELRILGSASATPFLNRHHTAQVLTVGNHLYLIDCGEGTQERLIEHKVRHQRISTIFISHLHGDHFFGLFGLISTMHLQGRTDALQLFGPVGLDDILTTQFRYSNTQLSFELNFTPVNSESHEQIYEDKYLTVNTLPMRHRIPCCGYLFREKPKRRHLVKDRLPVGLTPKQLHQLTLGEDALDETTGQVLVQNSDVTSPPSHSRSYAFCADTLYTESLAELIQNVDLLYHEATFLDDMRERALTTHHSTARQAALLARKAQAHHLLIGHFSSRYRDLDPLLREAQVIFEPVELATEGKTISVPE